MNILSPRTLLVLVAFGCGLLRAQNFVYTNDSLPANTVSGFSADSSGKLTAIPGSPFPTGGNAGGVMLGTFSANRIVTTTAGNRLFVSNDSDGSLTSFTVNPATGALTRVANSATSLGACNAGFSLAVSPDGTRLIAGSLCSANLQNFSINSDGTLSSLGNSVLSGCSASKGATSSLKYTGDGKFVAVADRACGAIEVFRATVTANLSAVAGSPFAQKSTAAPVSSLDISCSNSFLYAAGTPDTGTGTIDTFTLSPTGVLAEVAGGIIAGKKVDLQSTTLTPDGRFLVTSGWDATTFTVHSVAANGSLTEIGGSPFGFGDISPAQIAVSADGKFIYYAEDTDDPSYTPGIGVLTIDANGVLTQVSGSPFRNPKASFDGGNNSLAAFPPKACAAAPTGPVPSLNTTVLNFTQAVGAPLVSQTATLTNTGVGNLTVSGIQLSGDPSFSVSKDCFNATLAPSQSCPVSVVFNPTTPTTVHGAVTLTTNGTPATQVITLNGSGQGVGISLTNSSFTFSTPIGSTSATQSVDVKSTGTLPLVISTIQVTGAGFNVTGNCANTTLQPQQVCTLQISYTAASGSTVTGTIVINDNATPNQQTITLTGSSSSPALSFSPTSLTISSTVGVKSAVQNVQISSVGGSALVISNIQFATPGAGTLDFGSCLNGPVQAGSSCTVGVSFTPQAAGTVQTSLIASTNASPAQQSIPVTLIGTAVQTPVLTVSPTSISFPTTVVGTSSQPRTVTLTNSGTGPLSVTSVTTSNNNVYSVTAPQCPPQLAAGQSCTATVNFHPTASGNSPQASMGFVSNAATNPSITLNGTGTLKNACPDADGDGLCDDWEVNGISVHTSTGDYFIDLPKMGANPNHKDIFIQADWMAGTHSHAPNPLAMSDIVEAFANAPVHNPDNNDGITMHIDCGSDCPMSPGATWGSLSAATSFPETQFFYSAPPAPGTKPVPTPDTWVLFDKLSTNFVNSGRALIFHHAIFGHYQNPSTTSSGLSSNASGSSFDLGASKVMVTLGGFTGQVGSRQEQSGTLMHELGHNLSLHHGGNDEDNYKPNYISVMNYAFQISGISKDLSDGLLDYSRFELPMLDESNLNEQAGLRAGNEFPTYGTRWFCLKTPLQPRSPQKAIEDARGFVDWNCDTHFTSGVSEDINGAQTFDANGNPTGGRLIKTLAASQFDWDKLKFAGGALAGQGVGSDDPADTPITEITSEQAYQMQPFTGVRITAPNTLRLTPGTSVTLAIVIRNIGSKADTYTFTSNAPAGWLDASAIPASIDLQPNTSATVRLTLSVPQTLAIGTNQTLRITAQSKNYPRIKDTAQLFAVGASTPDPLIASVSELTFPLQDPGTKGNASALTLTNSSGAASSIASITIAGDFQQTNDCGTTLAVGATCIVQVVFAPTASGVRTGILTIASSAAGSPLAINLTGVAGDVVAGPTIAASVNAASGQVGALAAGTLFSIYGSQLSTGTDQANALPLPTQLAGASITVGGVPAPLLYVSPGQINLQVPYGLPTGPTPVVVTTGSGSVVTSSIQIAAATPGLFLLYGTKHLAAQNVDYSLNGTTNPAPSGGIVVVYFTGQGAVDQAVTSGTGAPSAVPANVSATVTATIGGFPAKVLFAGLTPGTVGLAQANLVVPTAADGTPLPNGDYDVIITVGGVATPAGSISIGK